MTITRTGNAGIRWWRLIFGDPKREGGSWSHVPRKCNQEVTIGGHLHRCTTIGEHYDHTCAGTLDKKPCGFRWAH